MEKDLRLEAIKRYKKGESATDICQDLQRTRAWLYKWLKRKDELLTGNPEFKAHNRTPEGIEQAVTKARKKLMKHPYSQIGINAINHELHKQHLSPVASATIDRIIKRAGLVRKPKPKPYSAKGKIYPKLNAICANHIHQADLVGPRYIKNDGRLYCLNIMDIYTHRVSINPCRTKGDNDVVQGLITSWKRLGMPDFLQIDNELSFRGSNRHPHSLGVVLRLCLHLEIQPLFIPPSEPWRNGEIENFQKTFDRAFYRSQFYPSFKELCRKAEEFECYHNEHYFYNCIKGKTPQQTFAEEKKYTKYLPASFRLPQKKLPIEQGYIHLIRFIRSNRKLDIFGEHFKVSKDLTYEYVKATICTDIHTLQVRLDDKLFHSFDYRLPIE